MRAAVSPNELQGNMSNSCILLFPLSEVYWNVIMVYPFKLHVRVKAIKSSTYINVTQSLEPKYNRRCCFHSYTLFNCIDRVTHLLRAFLPYELRIKFWHLSRIEDYISSTSDRTAERHCTNHVSHQHSSSRVFQMFSRRSEALTHRVQ